MDTATQLALISKAKKVFAADDTFLSYPVTPLRFDKRQLNFTDQHDADAARLSLRNLESFSTLVNLIPEDEAWMPSETEFLWDIYNDILRQAEYATSLRSPEEEADYQKTLAFLRKITAEGLIEDSYAVKVYRQHKDAFLLAQQAFLAAKSTAEASSDPNEQQQWKTIDEPRLRGNLNTLETNWILAGHKNEVEAAQATVGQLGARSPLLTRNEWLNRFNRDLDSINSAGSTLNFFPSFFAPSNAIDEGSWNSFKISDSELTALIDEAPAELRARFAGSLQTSIKSLSFEFSSAVIIRPWFVSDVFRSRFWRYADPAKVISTGNSPSSGACPAYVTAVVFARKLNIEMKPSVAPTPLKMHANFQFSEVMKFSKPVPNPPSEVRPIIRPQFLRVERKASTIPMVPMAHVLPREDVIQPLKVTNLSNRVTFNRLDSSMIRIRPMRTLPLLVPIGQPTEPVPPPPPPPDNSIYILALICRRVAKCPDPDPSLAW